VYSNSIKNENDLIYAEKKGVRLTTADSFDELRKIQKYAPKAKILWRIAIKEVNSAKLATIFSNKFGDDYLGEAEMEKTFSQIFEMGIRLEGIHFHCGSG